jgi:lysophospholipase L1-like esterase
MMSLRVPKSARKFLALTLALATGAILAVALPAGADPQGSEGHAVRPGSGYLALGDSVVFGYREADNLPTPDYSQPDTFVGYPEDVAADLSLNVTNASCPGETSASLIDATAPSNGCENGYRAAFPLHTAYSGSQLDFAVQFLRTHHQTRLVSLMIGANDGFLCQKTTPDQCQSELPALLQKVGANVATILQRIRDDAHYNGQIVIVNYYSLDYRSAVQNGLSQALNGAVDAAAQPFDVQVADGFAAFQSAALQTGGDTCAAGLLTTLPTGGCGTHVHPSVTGQALLAEAVDRAVRKG